MQRNRGLEQEQRTADTGCGVEETQAWNAKGECAGLVLETP